jgi:hypothetical protein
MQLTENKQQRSKSIASSCRNLSAPPPHLTNPRSPIAPFLFDTNKPSKIIILIRALMKTKEKRFSIQYNFATYGTATLARRVVHPFARRHWFYFAWGRLMHDQGR